MYIVKKKIDILPDRCTLSKPLPLAVLTQQSVGRLLTVNTDIDYFSSYTFTEKYAFSTTRRKSLKLVPREFMRQKHRSLSILTLNFVLKVHLFPLCDLLLRANHVWLRFDLELWWRQGCNTDYYYYYYYYYYQCEDHLTLCLCFSDSYDMTESYLINAKW